MNQTESTTATAVGGGPAHEVIAWLAEQLWEKEGRPGGRDMEFWLRAEAVLRGTNDPIRDEPKT